jgi:hypothetical protein
MATPFLTLEMPLSSGTSGAMIEATCLIHPECQVCRLHRWECAHLLHHMGMPLGTSRNNLRLGLTHKVRIPFTMLVIAHHHQIHILAYIPFTHMTIPHILFMAKSTDHRKSKTSLALTAVTTTQAVHRSITTPDIIQWVSISTSPIHRRWSRAPTEWLQTYHGGSRLRLRDWQMIRADQQCQAELPSLPNAGHGGQIFKPGAKLTPDLQAE